MSGANTFNPLHGRENNVFMSWSTANFRCIFFEFFVFLTFKWTYILLSTDRELSENEILKVYFVAILT
jgi:hypothetical protein